MSAKELAYDLEKRGCNAESAVWIAIKYAGSGHQPVAALMALACGVTKKQLVRLEERDLKMLDYNICPLYTCKD
jgi:hypothetical protein